MLSSWYQQQNIFIINEDNYKEGWSTHYESFANFIVPVVQPDMYIFKIKYD